ncbi:MAG: DUF2971 domain-containing protein [Petrotogales bacterium]
MSDVLYNYSSNEAFLSIIKNRSIWLSSLSSSNDTLEGQIVFRVIEDLAKLEKMDGKKINDLNDFLYFFQQYIDNLGLCLSEEGDLLSQWRGYANDGKGMSIGFSKDYLDRWANDSKSEETKTILALTKTLYNYENILPLIKPLYLDIKKEIDKGALDEVNFGTILNPKTDEEIEEEKQKYLNKRNKLVIKALPIINYMYKIKNEAFKEEKEWRLRTVLLKSENEDCLFRNSNTRIIPYKEMNFPDFNIQIIKRIYIGPKNDTPIYTIKCLLSKYNFKNVEVKKSKASYR